MHLSFESTRATGPLSQTRYTFVLIAATFVLSEYMEEYKIHALAGWRIKRQYSRVIDGGNTIEADQIIIPEDVKAELVVLLTHKLTVAIWPKHN